MENTFRIGLDVGSTTAKMVVTDAAGRLILSDYRRHQTRVGDCLAAFHALLLERLGTGARLSVSLTGSVGMGVAERCALPFVQEVVAAAQFVGRFHPQATTLIDIGGEDAKMVFFSHGSPADLRMNGNCAGGTGAFIDQMAALLRVGTSELSSLACRSARLYPIASRCGVFCKTDIQNLIARNVPREDIAASIFHAVAVQTIVTLAHGHTVEAPILLCGGPLTFLPALRTAFADYLHLPAESFIVPDHSHLVPAWGTALAEGGKAVTVEELGTVFGDFLARKATLKAAALPPIFPSEAAHEAWRSQKAAHAIARGGLREGRQEAVVGIDSGSTTTKIVLLDLEGRLLFSHYQNNDGNPIKAVGEGLRRLEAACRAAGTQLQVVGSCSTGYGEDLIKAAFALQAGIVETMAHFMAARHISPDVSFVLDIGGQDMKAMFVSEGSIERIEVNEACSSGCGSFISTFAQSLGHSVDDFAQMACLAAAPCDLGTRCTVFMNSKVKQVLRDGAGAADIAAGLSYSVVKNCLYKVLRLSDTSALGDHIVVQGGTMRNDSVVRALELLTQRPVHRSDMPELMGAVGCALYALQLAHNKPVTLQQMLAEASYTSRPLHCRGCENQCAVACYKFSNGGRYYSGNRCEKVFSNSGGGHAAHGKNAYEEKRRLLFKSEERRVKSEEFNSSSTSKHMNSSFFPLHSSLPTEKNSSLFPLPSSLPTEKNSSLFTLHSSLTIGLPRVLNMFEEYPFWNALLTECGMRVVLSEVTSFAHYEQCASHVMSDNICFPAKLVHSHIDDLRRRGVDRILMPFVVYERQEKGMANSYNCPIVTGYSQVVKSVEAQDTPPIDSPTIAFDSGKALFRQCRDYLRGLGVAEKTLRKAFCKAMQAQDDFEKAIALHNKRLLDEARREHRLIVVLAGRPYHADALIQHKVAEMIAAQGACVLTDDIVRQQEVSIESANFLAQWAFPDRILKAAEWAAGQGEDVQFMQLTSFGCGPDAFLTDEIGRLLHARGKNLTLLKIDDVNNIGSLRLRVRSLIESLNVGLKGRRAQGETSPTLPIYNKEQRRKKIIIPFFTPFISPLLPSLLSLEGYDVDCLPMSDEASADWGLKYSNNEICYPATLIVGDIVKAFRSGRYDPSNTCVAMTQTGGQCRASNYLSLIRHALVANGYTQTAVISVAFGSGLSVEQPGFRVNWMRMLPMAVAAILFSDCLARMFHAAVVRERVPGEALRLKKRYLAEARQLIRSNAPRTLYKLIGEAAAAFNSICQDEDRPRVGLVGEIFLKFHPFAQKHVTEWLISRGVEIVYPSLMDFFVQTFVNQQDSRRNHLSEAKLPDAVTKFAHRILQSRIAKANAAASRFRFFMPLDNIFEKAALAQQSITLSAQFGEGWLIAGEVGALYQQGVSHIVSLQPFGCIANHIVEKGIENRLRRLYPGLNILSLDFDNSVSEVNIANRLLLFINNLKH